MSVFQFKRFTLKQNSSAMKFGTDSRLLGSLIDVKGKVFSLDVGTGTGVLSLMLAQRNEAMMIDAIEIESDAFVEAKENVSLSLFSSQISLILGDFYKFESLHVYDLIFSNPPFFYNSLKNKDDNKSIARHTLRSSIVDFVEKVNLLLSNFGHVWVIIPYLSLVEWGKVIAANGFFIHKMISVYSKPGIKVRIIVCFSKVPTPFLEEVDILIRDEFGFYTQEYVELTKEYHLNTPLK